MGAANVTRRWSRAVPSVIMGEGMSNGREWVSTNHRMTIPGNLERVPPYTGDHLWTWEALFRATPGAEVPMLNTDNLLRVAGIACHHCGSEYDRAAGGRFCNGKARHR